MASCAFLILLAIWTTPTQGSFAEDVVSAVSSQPSTYHPQNCTLSQYTQVIRCGLDDLTGAMIAQKNMELVCEKYDKYNRCVVGYSVPPICRNVQAWVVNDTASYLCGPGREGVEQHGSCLKNMKHFSNATSCKKLDVSESKIMIQILMLFDIPLNESHDAIWIRKQEFQLYCHTWPAIGACIRDMTTPQCGKQAADLVLDFLSYFWTNIRPFMQFIEDTDPRRAGLYICRKNFTGVPGLSPGHELEFMINKTRTLAQQAERYIELILPIVMAEYGVCGDMTQLAVILKCILETMAQFSPGPHHETGVTVLEVIDTWCINGVSLLTKCEASEMSSCPGSLASEFYTTMTELCLGVHGAVGSTKCQSVSIDDLFSDHRIQERCNTSLSLFQTITLFLNFADLHHFNFTQFKEQVTQTIKDTVCTYTEAEKYVPEKIAPLCGTDVADHFIRALQGGADFYGQLGKDISDLVYTQGRIPIKSHNARAHPDNVL